MSVKLTPDAYLIATPCLIFNDTSRANEFFEPVSSAPELMHLSAPVGKNGQTEIKIGNSPSCWQLNIPNWAQ